MTWWTRYTIESGMTKKDTELTHEQMDENFVNTFREIKTLKNPTGITAYSSVTTYPVDAFTLYNNLLWKRIGSGNTTDVTPGSDATKWREASIAEIVHLVNHDTKLAEGTDNEVSASALRANLDKPIPVFTPAKNFAGGTGAGPPTEVDGDVYVVTNDFGDEMTVDTIQFQGGTVHTVRYQFTGDFTMLDSAAVGDWFTASEATNPKHDGTFQITAYDNTAGWVEIYNPLVSNAGDNEASSTATGYFTKQAWDGAKYNDVAEFKSSAGTWHLVTPFEGQVILNVNTGYFFTFKNGAWTTQQYSLPEQPKAILLLANVLLDTNTTSDQSISLNTLPGTVGFTKFVMTDTVITNAETTITTLDDLRFYSGAGRTGDYFFEADNAALLNVTINTGYISASEGSITRHDKKLAGTVIHASFGTTNGTATAIRVRIFGHPIA